MEREETEGVTGQSNNSYQLDGKVGKADSTDIPVLALVRIDYAENFVPVSVEGCDPASGEKGK